MAGGVEHFCQASRISSSARKRSRFLLTAAFGMDVLVMDGFPKRMWLFGQRNSHKMRGATAP
jgi:hypothetical protein